MVNDLLFSTPDAICLKKMRYMTIWTLSVRSDLSQPDFHKMASQEAGSI